MYHDEGVEAAVLGMLLRYPDRIHDCGVTAKHFWREDHAQVLRAFEDKGVSLAVAAEAMYGDVARAMELSESAWSDAGLEQHLTYLRNLADKRTVKRVVTEIMEGLGDLDHSEVAAAATEGAARILAAVSGADSTLAYGEDCEDDLNSEGGERMETFIRDLPVCRRELIGVAARPGCGKTTMAHLMGEHFTKTREGAFPVFTMEVTRKEWFQRTIRTMYGRPIDQYRADGQKNPAYAEAAEAVRKSYASRMGRLVVDEAVLSVQEIRARCLRIKAKHGSLSGVAIDQLSNIRKVREKGMNASEVIKNTTEAVKQLSRELDCPAFLLSQLNRDPSGDEGWYTDRDIFGSDGLLQDADQIWILQHPPGSNADGKVRPVNLRRTKWRNGSKGELSLEFHAEASMFYRTL